MELLVMADRIKKSPYARMYCGTWLDDKVLGLSLEAEAVYYRAIWWSKEQDLDGLVPMSALSFLCQKCHTAPDKIAAELLAAGLWVELAGGVGVDPDRFAEYQITKAKRAAETKRKRDWREQKHADTNGHTTGEEP